MLDYEEAQNLIFGLSQAKRTEGYHTVSEYAETWGKTRWQARGVIDKAVEAGVVKVLREVVKDKNGLSRLQKVYGFIEQKTTRRSK